MDYVNRHALHKNMDTGSLCMDHVANMRKEFFWDMTYGWWHQVEPGDVCVDIGSCIGMFTAMALDEGASKVYMIEPNRGLLETAMNNVRDYVINAKESPIVPVHAAIMNQADHVNYIYNEEEAGEYRKLTFAEFIDYYNIDHIDYLKIDCEGGEYDILTKENLDWIYENVDFIALEVHRRHTDTFGETGSNEFRKFRDEFLKRYWEEDRVQYQYNSIKKDIWNDGFVLADNLQDRYGKLPPEFMIYFTPKNS